MENPFTSYMVLPDLTVDSTYIDFVVNDFIDRDSVTLLVSAPGCGKTALSFHLAKCLSTGGEFLGMQTRVLGRCAFLQFDMSERKHIAYNKMFAPDCPIRFISGNVLDETRNPVDLTDTKTLSNLKNWCHLEGIEVLFIDTLSTAFIGLDENSNSDMTMAMQILRSLSQSGITVIALHHVAKGEYGYSTHTRGASALTGCADNEVKLIQKPYGIELVVTKSRCSDKGTKATFTIDNGIISTVNKIEEKLDSDEERLMNAFTKVNVMSRQDVVKTCKLGPNKTQLVLANAVAKGLLQKNREGKCDIYTLIRMS